MISIVICTYNRAALLSQTLESLKKQRNASAHKAEILVVDNNSKDETRKVTEAFSASSPWLVRHIFETRQGVSYARNRGISEAKGEIVAYLDDDVEAEPEWLENMAVCFAETGADVIGGRIERKWDCEKPEWLVEEISAPLIRQNFGDKRVSMTSAKSWMVTANLAFRRRVFEKCGVFDVTVGRRAGSLVGGEEPEMFRKLHAAGFKVFYEPKAVVWHKVEKERLSKDYMRRWFFDTGRTIGHQMEWKSYHRLTILPLWAWKEWLNAAVILMASMRFSSELWVRYYSGIFIERLASWLPFGMGRRLSAFAERKS
jgi:glucosyl-dolichyl phosphate glucuronosyltransferase